MATKRWLQKKRGVGIDSVKPPIKCSIYWTERCRIRHVRSGSCDSGIGQPVPGVSVVELLLQ